jgi:potassium channel
MLEEDFVFLDPHRFVSRLVFKPDNYQYGYFAILLGISETLLSYFYPWWTAFGFPFDHYDHHLWILVFGEIICFLDIVLHFFMSYKEQGNNEYERDFKKIALRYLRGNFAFDMFKFLPLGAFGIIFPNYRGW